MTHDSEQRARILREYLLGTLDHRERARIEAEIAASDQMRRAVEQEREALALLAAAADVKPPENLAEKTVRSAVEREHDRMRRRVASRRWAYAEAAVLLLVAGAVLAFVLPALSRAREAARRASSQNNLKQIGIALKMYSAESKGEYLPTVAPYEGIWTFDFAAIYPKYVSDLSVFVNPSLPDAAELLNQLREIESKKPIDYEAISRIAARSYSYVGWMVTSDEDIRVLAKAVQGRKDVVRRQDLDVGGRTLHRMKEGVERFLVTDINDPSRSSTEPSTAVVVLETPSEELLRNRPKPGLNVLYMDGRVEFVPMNQRFPATEGVREVLGGN